MNWEKLAREIYDKKTKGKLNAKLLEHYASQLLNGMNQGYGTSLEDSKLSPEDRGLLEALTGNIYQFSGAKSYHELYEYNQLLVDEKGKIRTWAEFSKNARQIHETYNVHYLATEYQHAVNTSLMIKRWNDQWAEREALPYLRYDAVLDDRTRDEHARLSGIVKLITDPFWNTYYPPLGWNCRCEALQTGTATAEELGQEVPELDIPKAFQNNAALDKKVFSDAMPYFEHMPAADKKLLSLKNLSQLVNSPLLKKLADKQVKGGWYETKRIFVENGCEKEIEYIKNLDTAKLLSKKWQNDIRLKFPVSKNKFNYDAEIGNKKFEFKHPVSSNFGTLDSQLRKGKKQAPNIVFHYENISEFNGLKLAFDKRMKKSKSWDSFTIIHNKKLITIERNIGKYEDWIKKIESIYR